MTALISVLAMDRWVGRRQAGRQAEGGRVKEVGGGGLGAGSV